MKSEMPKIFLILSIVLLLAGIGEKGFGQTLYKWVDEKGTVHFSDDPPPQTAVKEGKKSSKENTEKILKNLEFGNREIPDDMKKYGPGSGGSSPSQSRGGQGGGSSGSSSKSTKSTPARRS